MADEIKIFELKIDVDAAIKAQSTLKKEADSVKASLQALKKAGDTTSEAYVELEARSKNLNREYNASQTQLGKLIKLKGKEIKTVEQGRNALTILNKEWAKATNLYGANSKEADALAIKHKELKDRVNDLQKGVGDTSANIGRYSDGMKEAIESSGLLSKAQKTVTDVLNIATPVYTYAKNEVKSIKDEYNKGKKAIATYTLTQKEATVTTASSSVTNNLLARSQRAVAISTNIVSGALKLLKVALIATGIGAIIVLLGSLVAWFSQTQAGIDFVNQALASLSAAFNVLSDRFSKFGGIVFDLISGQATLSESLDKSKEALSGVGDEMSREIQLARELEKELQKLERREIATNVARSEINKQIKEYNKIAEDVTKTEQERTNAINKAISVEQNQIKIENNLANDRLKNALGLQGTYDENKKKIDAVRQAFIDSQNNTEAFEKTLRNIGIDETLDEDIKEIGDSIKKNNDEIGASADKLTTLVNKKNTIEKEFSNQRVAAQKERIALSKKEIDNEIKASKLRLQIFEQENKDTAKTLNDGIAFQEDLRDKRLSLLSEEVSAGKKTKLEAELEELRIKDAFLKAQADLVIEFANQELDIYLNTNKSRLENGQLLTDSIVNQEVERLNRIAEKQREFEAKRLEQGVISQKEFNDAINAVDEENRVAKADLETERKEQQKEADLIDLENERALQQENLNFDLEFQLNELNTKKQAELDAAEKTGANKALIEKKYALQEQQLTEAVNANKLQLASQAFGNLSAILGKESAAGKAAAIAQTTIDTYQGATAAYKSLAGIPVVGPALGAVAAGAAIEGGVANVKKIASTQTPKAAKGITLKGNRHTNGGIDLFDGNGAPVVNAEADENIYVVNRRASALINGLSTVNELTGGVPLSTPTNFAMAGGLVQRSLTSNFNEPIVLKQESIDYDLMAEKIGQANQLLPPPVTQVEDIISGVGNFNSVVDGANL